MAARPTKRKAARKKKPAAAKTERILTDDQIVNPEREVKLSNGTRVLVEPWGMKQGNLVLARLDALGPAFASQSGEGWNARALLSAAWDEVVDLVSLTIDVERDEMEQAPRDGGWTFEDVLEVTEAIVEVCLLRSDGRGALPLLVALVTTMTEVAVRSIGQQRGKQLSNGSTTAGTSAEASGSASD